MGSVQSAVAVDEGHAALDVEQPLLPDPTAEQAQSDAPKQEDPAVTASLTPASTSCCTADAAAMEPKQCRICFEEAGDDPQNPLISPCRCSGSMKYIHRQCLATWHASAKELGGEAWLRCEACHFEYQYRRLWWSALLRNHVTNLVIFVVTFALLCYAVGFIPFLITDIDDSDYSDPYDKAQMHMLNGLLILGAVGCVYTSVLVFLGRQGTVPTLCSLWADFVRPGRCSRCAGLMLVVWFPYVMMYLAQRIAYHWWQEVTRYACEHVVSMIENVA